MCDDNNNNMMNWYPGDWSAVGGANQAMYGEIDMLSAADSWSSNVCGDEDASQTSPFNNSVALSHGNGWSPLSYVQSPVHQTSPQLTRSSPPLPMHWSTGAALQTPLSDGSQFPQQQKPDSSSMGTAGSPIVDGATAAGTRHVDDAANRHTFVSKTCLPLPLEQVSRKRKLQSRDEEFSTKVRRDAKGNRQHIFRATAKQRAALLPQDRKSTELTRKIGSCARCKRQKIRVSATWREPSLIIIVTIVQCIWQRVRTVSDLCKDGKNGMASFIHTVHSNRYFEPRTAQKR